MKKLLRLLLVVVMTISILVGCANNSGNVETNQQKEEIEKQENDDAKVVDDGREMEGNMYLEGFPIVKEPIKIRVAAVDAWNSENYATKKVVQQYAELTNIEVEWIHIDYATKEEKLNLMFSNLDDLPDLFLFLDYDKVDKLGKDGVLLNVKDLLPKYAPNVVKAMEAEPVSKKLCASIDGEMYYIPSMYVSPGEKLRGSTYINKVWLDNLNLEMPTTVDEYYKVLKEFKENDPNGNGKADEIPLSFNWTDDLNGIASSFSPWGVISANFGPMYAKDQKDIVISVMEDNYKEAIKYFHKLYKEGLMDQEVFTQGAEKLKAKEDKMDEFILGSGNSYAPLNPTNKDYEKEENDFVFMPPLEGPAGKNHIMPLGGGLFINNYITASTKYPKEVLRWIDGIADAETSYIWNGGGEGICVEKNEDGKWQQIINDDGSIPDRLQSSYLFPIMGVTSEWYTENVKLPWGQQMKKEMLDAIEPIANIYIVDSHMGALKIKFTDDELDTITMYLPDIEQFCKNKEAQWIMEGGVEEEWEDFKTQLKQMNIDKVAEIYQTGLDRWNK
jgi:putative aldouronate transport system substrate-binding protein